MAKIPVCDPSTSPHALFLEGVRLGGIVTQEVAAGARQFPPRLAARRKLPAIDTVPLVRSGTVFSATQVHTKGEPYILALVDLDGGGRLLVRMRERDEPERMLGCRVVLANPREANEPILTFTFAEAGD
jgi:uncharacterized OB-fold protein